MNQLPSRISGACVALACLWYLPWLVTHLNRDAIWLSVPFLVATLLMAVNVLITMVNNWDRSVPEPRWVAYGAEPTVAVIVPTCGEPVLMVERTVQSVIEQDWPLQRLVVVVSDDAAQPLMRAMVARLAAARPTLAIHYHLPPKRGEPGRRGDAKSGNLNSALDMIRERYPAVPFIETRDADDCVGDTTFLRQAVGQLLSRPNLAYVQSIKEAAVHPGDPFANLDPLFYRGAMFARNAANAVFPCGSGLVWRHTALTSIDDFPTWNLVEDLHSGVEALRRGWSGAYLPIIGAMGQTAPEDIPNVYKQRGTWALDTLRLLFWGDLRGLTLRQRLHFAELGFFYLQGFVLFTFLGTLVLSLVTGIQPVERDPYAFVIRFWPFVISVEVFLACLNQGNSFEALWRLRQIWVGLAPIFVKASFLAIFKDPRFKPAYKVTRKDHRFSWYWRETGVQIVMLLTLVMALGVAFSRGLSGESFDPTLMYWTAFYAVLLGVFIPRGWHGLSPRNHRVTRSAVRRGLAAWELGLQSTLAVRSGVTRHANVGAIAVVLVITGAFAAMPTSRVFITSLAAALSPQAAANAQDAFIEGRVEEVQVLPLEAVATTIATPVPSAGPGTVVAGE